LCQPTQDQAVSRKDYDDAVAAEKEAVASVAFDEAALTTRPQQTGIHDAIVSIPGRPAKSARIP
jgi:hypothetical protein